MFNNESISFISTMSIDLLGNILLYTGFSSHGNYLKRVTRDGLVLELDAGNLNSYPGTGLTWYDLSGFGHDFTHGGAGLYASWHSDGYFLCTGGTFSGPASNLSTWGFNNRAEHYIEIYCQMTSFQSNWMFKFEASPSLGADSRGIASHLGYGMSGLTYYDVGGYEDPSQRISGYIGANLTGSTNCISYLCRTGVFQNRKIYKNLTLMIDSGTEIWPPTVTWNDLTSVVLFSDWLGKVYLIRVYNRPLNPYEIAENFQATRGRFGI